MYKKNLFIIPPAGGKTRVIVPEIIRTEKAKEKTVFWLTDQDNVDYSGLTGEGIQTLSIEQWESQSFENGRVYQLICPVNMFSNEDIFAPVEEAVRFILTKKDDINSSIVIDKAQYIIGNKAAELLCESYAADIFLLFDQMDQVYDCISKDTVINLEEKIEYRTHKFIEKCRREFNIYKNNRSFWIENMGVEKVKRKKGDTPDTPKTRPIPTYQPYDIFGCTLFHYKQGSFPGMSIEEMVEAVRSL